MEMTLDELQDRISEAMEIATPDVELVIKSMFGGRSGYAGGRVFASLSNIGLALKLGEADQAILLAEPGAKRLRYEPDAPESKQYIVVPPDMVRDSTALAGWAKRSVDYVMTLPAPKPKRAKSKE